MEKKTQLAGQTELFETRMPDQSLAQWTDEVKYLQHSVTIGVRQCCFETSKFCLIVLIEIEILYAELCIFHFNTPIPTNNE